MPSLSDLAPKAIGMAVMAVPIAWLGFGAPGPSFFSPTEAAPAVQLVAHGGGEPLDVPRPRRATFLLFWAST